MEIASSHGTTLSDIERTIAALESSIQRRDRVLNKYERDSVPFRFLDLPGEIRNQIYDICIQDGIPVSRNYSGAKNVWSPLNGLHNYRSLARVNRQLRQEYLPLERAVDTAVVDLHKLDFYLKSLDHIPNTRIAIRYQLYLFPPGRDELVVDLLPLLRHCHAQQIESCQFYAGPSDGDGAPGIFYNRARRVWIILRHPMLRHAWKETGSKFHELFEPKSPLMTALSMLNLLEAIQVCQMTIKPRPEGDQRLFEAPHILLRITHNPSVLRLQPREFLVARGLLFSSMNDTYHHRGTVDWVPINESTSQSNGSGGRRRLCSTIAGLAVTLVACVVMIYCVPIWPD